MMSFEECQAWGKKRREEKAALEAKCAEIRKQEMIKQGINPDSQNTPAPKYEHPAMPGQVMMTILFIVGYIGSFIFKDWWIPWIILTVLLGKYLSRHDND